MSVCAPTRELTPAELAAELCRALAVALDRIASGGGVVSCTSLDTDTEAGLFGRLCDRTPARLAEVHAAADARLDGWLDKDQRGDAIK